MALGIEFPSAVPKLEGKSLKHRNISGHYGQEL